MITKTRVLLTLGALLVTLVFAVPVAFAETLSPWFHVSSTSVPTNLQPGGGKDEEQELTVSATGGDVLVADFPAFERSGFTSDFADVPWDATGQQMQEGLQRAFPERAVSVEEETAKDTSETHSWKITFLDQSVEPVFANGAFAGAFGGEPLSCEGATGPCTGEATVNELSKGEPTGNQIELTVTNVGDAAPHTDVTPGHVVLSSPLDVADALPKGVRAVSVEGSLVRGKPPGEESLPPAQAHCDIVSMTCSFAEGVLPPFLTSAKVTVAVVAEPGGFSGDEPSVASVSGAGAPPVRAQQPLTLAKTPGEPAPFGVESYEVSSEEPGGVLDAQAGSHPFQLTTTVDLNERSEGGHATPAQLAKDLTFNLPAGLIGDPTAYPRCTLAQFMTITGGPHLGETNACPAGSVIGIARTTYENEGQPSEGAEPVFNLEPSVGEPARFGYLPVVPVFLGTSVRTGGDYGVTVHAQNITQSVGFLTSTVTFWGVPGDSRHESLRGTGCLFRTEVESGLREFQEFPCEAPPAGSLPFLSMPTSCTGALESTAEGVSWNEFNQQTSEGKAEKQKELKTAMLPALDGCGSLQFASEIKVSADEQTASTPSGLKVDVHVPQEAALNPEGLASADVKNITVTLPNELQLNPSSADGLQACTLSQIGYKGENPVSHTQEFTADEPSCPNASKVATVTLKLPILPQGQNLTGFVYLAAPQNFPGGPMENPFKSLVAMYLVARDPVSGILVKLPGEESLSPSGQITASFQNNPQAPFEDAEIEFFGGDRAPLATPAFCRDETPEHPGAYTTSAIFEPWTNGGEVFQALHSQSAFPISLGPKTLAEPGGSPCPGATLPFSPALHSSAANINAGGFTPLSTTLSREDGQQSISSVVLHDPPGLSGILTGVKLCDEADANAGTCGPESLIGETIVSVGVGGDPFTVTGGKVYLTEHYAGAPFGLSIVNPAKAGPFVLQEGRPVVVRAKIEVDPHTTALTISTDPAGSAHGIPAIIEGIPLQIKHVNVTITRPGFTFNPTSCDRMEIAGTISSVEGASSPVSVPFQVTNCQALKFSPTFTASTAGHTSKANGASLTVKVTRPAGPESGQANFALVKVSLPKALPSRLTTLQKACLARTFEANPAACPAGSIVGHARVITPLLPVPLEGPAYFVSHGGEAFPSLIFVLQGYGVNVQVISTTFISKAGITSATLKTLPDAPFTSFELTLPQGPDSALAANANPCKTALSMPTELFAQNGLVIRQSTPIHPTGCHKPSRRKPSRRKLAAALAACRRQPKTHRAVCDKQARHRYG